MSRRRRSRPEGSTRAAARTQPRTDARTLTASVALDDACDIAGDEATALHRRAVAIREARMGHAAMPAAAAVPTPTPAARDDQAIVATWKVKGMTCRSCEQRISRHVSRLPGVTAVTASAPRAQVTVVSAAPLATRDVERAINQAGYELGATPWLERDPRVWGAAGLGLLVVAAIGVVASTTRVGDLASGAGSLSSGGLLIALLLGLAAGVSTCMALVGGLVLGLSASFQASRADRAGTASQLRPAAVFVAGRISGYAAFGAVLGAIGASFTMPPALTAGLMLAVAVVMLILGTRLTGLSPRIAGWSPTLPSSLGRTLGLTGDAGPGAYSDGRAAILGAATFFLPCGFTQAVQVFALSTGSPVYAAALLGIFAAGTAPGLLAVAGLPLVVPSHARPTLLRVVGVVVIGFALLNASAGLRLAGVGFPSVARAASAVPAAAATTPADGTAGTQELRTYQDENGYGPAVATIAAGVPTAWHIDSRSAYSCATTIVVPELGIQKHLASGDNVIDLPALQAGMLEYTCGMGMYWGNIKVEAAGGAG